jgi:hypothetical protein
MESVQKSPWTAADARRTCSSTTGRTGEASPSISRWFTLYLPPYLWRRGLPHVDDAETAKLVESQQMCATAGLLFAPIGIDTFGAPGKHASAVLSQLFRRYADAQGGDPKSYEGGALIGQCWERVSIALHKALASQLAMLEGLDTDAPIPHLPGPSQQQPPSPPPTTVPTILTNTDASSSAGAGATEALPAQPASQPRGRNRQARNLPGYALSVTTGNPSSC